MNNTRRLSIISLGLAAFLALGCDDSDEETNETTTSSSSSGADTFTLNGTISVDSTIQCSDSDTDADCRGDVFWALSTEQCQTTVTEYLAYGVMEDLGAGDSYSLTDLPAADQLSLCTLLDDNGSSAGVTHPDDIVADQYDLYGGTQQFAAGSGDTITQTIAFTVQQQ